MVWIAEASLLTKRAKKFDDWSVTLARDKTRINVQIALTVTIAVVQYGI